VTLDPGALDVTGALTANVVPFAAPPAAVDPRAIFKVAARDLVTTEEVSLFAGVLPIGGPGDGAIDRDAAVAIAPLPDGGLYVLGTFSGTATFGAGGPNPATLTAEGGTDVFLARLSADRSLGFVAQIRSEGGDDAPRAAAALADGSVVITGAIEGDRSFADAGAAPGPTLPGGAGLDLFVAGYSGTGQLLFTLASALPVDDSGTAAAPYLDGSFLVAGFTMDQAEGDQIGFARVLPASRGSELESAFSGQAGGPGDDQPTAVATFPDGSAVIVGTFERTATFGSFSLTSRGGRDAFIARIDNQGAFTFARPIGGRGDDAALAVAAFAGGSAVVTGRFQGEAQASGVSTDVGIAAAGGPDDEDVFIVRFNQRGDIEFAVSAGGNEADAGLGVAALGDGSAVVSGSFRGTARFGRGPSSLELIAAGGTDAFLARYDARGPLQHASSAGGAGNDVGAAVAALSDGTMLMAGRFAGTATFGGGEAGETAVTAQGSQDTFVARHEPANYRLVEVRPEGLSHASVPGTGPNPNHLGSGVAIAGDGSSWVIGSFQGELVLRDDPDPGRRIALAASGNQDAFLARVLPDGTVSRAQQIGNSLGSSTGLGVVAFPDGGAVVTGSFKGPATFAPGVTLTAAGSADMFLARYRADGSLVFAVQGGGAGVDSGASVALLLEDEEILLTGTVDTSSALTFVGAIVGINLPARNRAADIFIARYSSAGEPLSLLLAGSAGDDAGAGIAPGVDESLWVTGQIDSASNLELDQQIGGPIVLAPAAAGLQGLLVHYADEGSVIVASRFGGPGRDAGAAVAALPDGGVLVTGSFVGTADFGDPQGFNATLTSAGRLDAFLARFRADGSLAFARRAGGVQDDEGLGVAALPDGSALVTGSFAVAADFGEGPSQTTLTVVENPRNNLHSDVFLARYDAAGNLSFARSAGGGGQDAGHGIAASPDGSAVITGAIGSGTAAGRQGPPIVFGAGEANETSFEDLEASGFVQVVVRSVFIARYFPYGAAP
jgi:hypothetical protein